jgi:muconate cycloisomerase
MKITRIETIPIRVPLTPALVIRSGRGGHHTVSPFLLVKIHTDDGAVGVGEASCTPRWSGEDQFTAAHFIDHYFAPLLIDEDPTQVESLTRKIEFPVSGNYFTKSAVEMALWDLAGKAANKPVYELLGGAVRDAVATKWSVSGQPPDKAAEIARWALSEGFTKMKVKVGIEPESDVARVRAVRQVVGSAMKLGVDANCGWATPEIAIATIERLRESGIYFAEQPIPPGDPDAMAQVRAAVKLPIIADESVYTLTDARVLHRHQACDVFSIYVGKSGGILPARRIADFAGSVGLKCTVGSNLELGVGSAAMVHLALASNAIDPENYPCDIIGPFFYQDDIVKEPLPILPGSAKSNGKPGLGVELDSDKVERYRVH